MAKAPLKTNVIRLGHLDPKSQLLVERDGDRLVLSPEEAINACVSHDQAKEMIARRDMFLRQTRMLTDKLFQWVEDRKEKVAEGYLQTRSDCQMFLIVLTGSEYDPAIERELTDLTIEVAGDPAFSMLRLDVQALPKCEPDDVRSFIDLDD